MNWRFWKREPTSLGKVIEPRPGGTIDDGLTYSLPRLEPKVMLQQMTAPAREQYLKESVANTFRFQFDTPQRTAADLPFQPPTEDPLQEWAITTREYVLEQTHAAVSRNPIAKRAVRYTSSFAVGEGFNLVCKHPEIEDVLNEFIEDEDNQIRAYERQVAEDLLTDGELFLRLYVGSAERNERPGFVTAVPQRPWECRWIRTEPGFFRRVISYHMEYRLTEGDSPTGSQSTVPIDVDADSMLHVPINRHSYELRGRPEIYPALPWLRAHKEFLENRARQNHWRSSFLWFIQVKNASDRVMAAVAARWHRPPSPGSVDVESDAVTVQPLVNPVQAGDSAEDGRQLKLMNAVAFGLPEYMLSDGSNANLASSTSQQLPALMTFTDLQYVLVEKLWYPLFERVLAEAMAAGRLQEQYPEHDADGEPVADGEMVDTIEGFTVSYRPVANEDLGTIANAFHMAVQDGAMSLETYCTRMGGDWAMEQKRMDNEKQKQMDDIAAGLRPPLVPPGMNPNQPPPAQEEPNAEEPAPQEPVAA